MPDPPVGGTRGRSAFDKAPALPPAPHRSVKTTAGVDSHFDPPAIHTAAARHPSRPQRLAARRPARPLPNGPLWPWLERPASPRARCGVGPSVFSHPRPPASTGRSSTRNPSGKGSSAASWRRSKRWPTGWPPGCPASPGKTGTSPSRLAVAFPHGTAGMGGTPQRRGGWRCTSPTSPMPIEACRDGGSLPSTSEERGSAPALRRTWRNRKRASDMGNRQRAHGNVVSVHEHPDVGCTRPDRHRARRNPPPNHGLPFEHR